MVDPQVLKAYGCTQNSLRRIFEAQMPANAEQLTDEERQEIQDRIDLRKRWETRISERQLDHINHALKNYQLMAAVDLAFDSAPINKETYPLVLYAQGKLNVQECASSLRQISCGADYIKLDTNGKVSGIDLPKFFVVNVNLIGHFVTRRLMAQTHKYKSLYPYLPYEARSTSQTAKLRADVMSQVADIMADNFGYREHDEDVQRDTLLYGHSIDFVRSAWERERQLRIKPPIDGAPEGAEIETEPYTVKEGVVFSNPHWSRVYWDNAFPLQTLNTDSGVSYVGYWDVTPYGTIKDNPAYWNRNYVHFSTGFISLFTAYQTYFSQYYDRIRTPDVDRATSAASDNDRLNNLGRYAGDDRDTAMLLGVHFEKLVPSEVGFGSYPHPVWVRFVTAGEGTIIFAEYLPDAPGAYCGHNERQSRQVNRSFAMDLMPYQDQMTNLLTQILDVCKRDQFMVVEVNRDMLNDPGPDYKVIEAQLKGKNWFANPLLIPYSGTKRQAMGMANQKVVELTQPRSDPQALQTLFNTMVLLIQTVERLTAMSANESGQPIVRGNGGVTATEAGVIAQTTNSVYGSLSDSFDEYRAAKKRILYSHYMAFGDADFQVPVTNRYPLTVIQAAGLSVVDEDQDHASLTANKPMRWTVTGHKSKLNYAYIFTSRDGADKGTPNVEAATALIQLLQVLQDPVVRQAIGKEKYLEMVGEIFRLASSFDPQLSAAQLSAANDEFDTGGMTEEQITGALEAITRKLEEHDEAFKAILQPRAA